MLASAERTSTCNNIRGWFLTTLSNCIHEVFTLTWWAGQSGPRVAANLFKNETYLFKNKKVDVVVCHFRSCLDPTLAVRGRRWRIRLEWMQRHAGTAGDARRPRRVSFKTPQILLRSVASCAEFDGAPSEIRPARTDGAHRLGLAWEFPSRLFILSRAVYSAPLGFCNSNDGVVIVNFRCATFFYHTFLLYLRDGNVTITTLSLRVIDSGYWSLGSPALLCLATLAVASNLHSRFYFYDSLFSIQSFMEELYKLSAQCRCMYMYTIWTLLNKHYWMYFDFSSRSLVPDFLLSMFLLSV